MRKIRKIESLVPKLINRKRVAAYARVSSGKEEMLHSLSAQVSYYSNLIQKNRGWEYIGVYADEAMTGTTNNRAEFQRLLTDCRDGKIDLVITKSISRFARNALNLLEAVRELKELDVDVYFEKENIYSMSGDGELMLTILASFAQEESRSVSENCKWRIRKRFAEGELVNLRFIFGYKVEKGEITIDPEQAEIVRMIFKDYISGNGCTPIAKKLCDMGIPRPRGGIWTSDRVAEIIKNEKYAGNALLQKKYVEDHLTKVSLRNKGELPQYYAEKTHPPIIEEATFQKAQVIMAKNREFNAGKKASGNYPFTSKIVCDKCGKNYKRKVKRGKSYWICSTYVKYGKDKCSSKQIPEEILTSVAKDVLGLEEFDEKPFNDKVKDLHVPSYNILIFNLFNGSIVRREWLDKSRSESWTEEARERARQKQLKYTGRGDEECAQLKQ